MILSHAHINLSVTTELGQLWATTWQTNQSAVLIEPQSRQRRIGCTHIFTHLHIDYSIHIYTVRYAFDGFDLYHNHLRLIVDIYPP